MNNRWLIDIGHAQNTFPPSKGVYLENDEYFAEHDFNYSVGTHIKAWANSLGIEVVLSQEDYKVDLGLVRRVWQRIKPMHKEKAFDGLISIHANASDDTTATGHGVFHYYNSTASKKMAEIWDRYADKVLDIPNWGKTGVWESLKSGWTRMYILWATPMPAILAEHFFFTNPSELEHCDTIEFVQDCAEVSIRTMCEYSGVKFKYMPTAVMDTWQWGIDQGIVLGEDPSEVATNRSVVAMLRRYDNR